jgi:heat shock protein HslJ/uncharacterized lipoprotein YbaY
MKQALTLLAAAAIALTGCTWNVDMRPDASEPTDTDAPAADPFFVQASLFYPERIALPGNAEVLVAVDAISEDGRTPLTRFTTQLRGQQVPIPLGFSVEPERAEAAVYELSAAVLAGDRLLRLTGPVLLRPVEGRAEAGDVRLRGPREVGFGQAWRCGAETVLFGAVDRRVLLGLGERLIPLEPQPSESGASYRSPEDPTVGVDETEGELTLVSGEERRADCRRIEPLTPPLTGGGNEPGWRVEVGSDRIELTSDYGQTVTGADRIATGSSGLTTRFRGLGEHGPILVAFQRRICSDSATGMPHPLSVEVQFEDGRLSGCGGEPRDLLTGVDWSVRSLDGEAVPETDDRDEVIEVTLRFEPDGRVSGRAACNRYSADYRVGGEGLTIGTIAATKMACPGSRSAVERRFLERLAAVRRFEIGRDGELVLIGPDGRIVAVGQGL